MGYKSGKLFEVPIGNSGKVTVTSLGERVYMRTSTIRFCMSYRLALTDLLLQTSDVELCT
jgi:hypothetical protein